MELKRFMKHPDTLIKQADKGGVVTALSKTYHEHMIYKHLGNQNTYQKLNKIIDPIIVKNLKNLLIISKYKYSFANVELKYLKDSNYNTSNFYALPEIHKYSLTQKAT